MTKFKNKYRIESTRAPWWDYGCNARYFITITTKNRVHCFGKVVDKKFIPSAMGACVAALYREIPNQFSYIELDEFVVMPDHVHMILKVDKPYDQRITSHEPDTGGFAGAKNPMLNENISQVIRWFKGRCAYEIRKDHPEFAWQSRFHDSIIHDDGAYQRVAAYIRNNPANWKETR